MTSAARLAVSYPPPARPTSRSRGSPGGGVASAAVELGELVVGAGEANLEAFDLAEPAFGLGLGDAGDQVVADLFRLCSLGWVWSQERTSDRWVFDLTYLFVAHDLAAVRHISDRVAVMYLGRIVEMADRGELYERPLHPYTQALLSRAPIPDPEVELERERIMLRGELPSPATPPRGCRFHTRCFLGEQLGGLEICTTTEPELIEHRPVHRAACHFTRAETPK